MQKYMVVGWLLAGCTQPTVPVEAERTAAAASLSATSPARITQGTDASSNASVGSVTARSSHGFRIYCPVSHFSYDDPVLLPGQPGAAHLHMFLGNTSVDAASDPSQLLQTGRATCEGGTNYNSGIWAPAMMTDQDEPVIPDLAVIYYKSFSSSTQLANAQRIPNGLSMLADRSTLNFRDKFLNFGTVTKDGEQKVRLGFEFPECVATDNGQMNGTPILRYQDMPGAAANQINSHVAYPGGPSKNAAGCPASHPYRFIGPKLSLFWLPAEVGSNWRLSSDLMGGVGQGESIHADYIAAIDDATNDAILRCIRESRGCGMSGGRDQLPERLDDPDGVQVYTSSVNYVGSPTPLGSVQPFLSGSGHHHGPPPAPQPQPAPPPTPSGETCDQAYGAANQFALCSEDPTSCEFFVQSQGDTCDEVCGGRCITGYDNQGTCGRTDEVGCNAAYTNQICICELDSSTPPPPPPAPLPSCATTYGGIAGFDLCNENATSCEFFARTAGSSCDDVCNGQCIEAYDNVGTCGLGPAVSCDTTYYNQICVCDR